MTPEATRTIATLRREFYSLFAKLMDSPVKITGSALNSSASIASWVDNRERLNYINIYAYSAPDELLSQRPLILKLTINKGAGSINFVRRDQPCRGLNQAWQFELTVLPEELLDFLPWVVHVVQAKAKGSVPLSPTSPYPVELDAANVLLAAEAWTQQARQSAALDGLTENPMGSKVTNLYDSNRQRGRTGSMLLG